MALTVSCFSAAQASADGPVGQDPSSNFSAGLLPPQCQTDPNGTVCVEAAVTYLNAARAHLGQPAYVLPGDFVSLTPPEQALVLTDLDRIQYGLSAVPGLTDALNRDAARGVQSEGDPQTSGSSYIASTSNWAGGYENMPLAYEAWMYDDGPGSGNLDCPKAGGSGCWGHRHDVLWGFTGGGVLAAGAASGKDSGGMTGYTMLLAEGNRSYRPTYTYTWAQAVAAGAGGPLGAGSSASGSGSSGSASTSRTPSGSGSHAKVRITSVLVHGHRVSIRITAPQGQKLHCSLARQAGHRWQTYRLSGCTRSFSITNVPAGRWRLRVSAKASSATRYFVVSARR
jgi:hypothetical protein